MQGMDNRKCQNTRHWESMPFLYLQGGNMKLKIDSNWIFVVLLVVLIGISVSNNRVATAESASADTLSIVSGNSGGTYYYIAAGQAKLITENLEGINVTTQSTSGSPVENMTLVERNPSTLGIVTLDGIYYAEQGDKTRGFDHPLSGLRGIQMGHTAYLYGLTLKESGIHDYSQMVGKRISVPPVGSTTYYMALAVAEVYGCNESNSKFIPMSSSEQADALKDGTIDVAFMAGGIPQATVTDLDFSVDLTYLTIDAEEKEKLEKDYPFWNVYLMDAGTYSKQTEPMNCLSVNTMLACNEKLDSETVYQITKILNEHTDELTVIHSSGSEWSMETTKQFLDSDIIQFHDGALRYYHEQGMR